MKYLIVFISLLIGSKLFAQDSLIISRHHFLNDEFQTCRHSKNQLLFLDTLIDKTQNDQPPYKGNGERFFKIKNEKLVILHINAGWICRLRGNYNEAHIYLSKGEQYLDSLKSYDLYSEEFKNTIGAYNNMQKQICYDTYQKDTAIFYSWNCARFFPELNEEPVTVNDTLASDSTNKLHHENQFGKFYLNDSLRIKRQFICDSIGVAYFNSIQHVLLNELRHNPLPQLLLEIMANQPFRQDTLIIKLHLENRTNKIQRESSIAFSTRSQGVFKYYLSLFNSINYPNIPEEVSFYIPIILRPESPNNHNKMHRIVIDDSYFLIEYETPKPIETD